MIGRTRRITCGEETWIERFCDAATTVGVFLCIVGLFWVMADCSMRIGDLTSKYIHSRNAVAGEKEDSVMSVSEIPFAWAVTANGRFIEAHGTKDIAATAVTVRESQMALIDGEPCEADGTPVEHEVIPLYLSPTLTDEERKALNRGIDALYGVEDVSDGACRRDDAAARTLLALLERLK
jgi:hypothetical protein